LCISLADRAAHASRDEVLGKDTWLLELFVRGTVPIGSPGIKKLETLTTILDKRQRHLIRGRVGDKSFFRKHKTGFGQLSALEQPCFVWGLAVFPRMSTRNGSKPSPPCSKIRLNRCF
jgi:hypothetical protein